MAMRPRDGGSAAAPRRGARSGGVRPVHEDFRPMSDWQHDDESHILNIDLPGFMREQIRVSTEARNTIRVRGERLVAGNKWSRFQEDFQVPENGEMNSIRAKFEGGTLTITVPKVKVDLPPKTESMDDIQKQPTPRKDQEKEVQTTSQATDQKGTEPQKSSRDTGTKEDQDGDRKQPTTQKGQDEAFPAVGARPTEERSLEPEKTSGDPKKEHEQERYQRPLKRIIVPQDNIKDEGIESKEKQIASERPDDVKKTKVDKEGKETIGNKESPDVETANKTKLKKGQARDVPEKNVDNKELYEAFTKEKYKKAVTGLTGLNEERQLLVNMGAAMLVIVALTAYVAYSFVSAKDKN